jgi:poly-gamma-glutamate synthesis protein (capsule biosynthesis protein)
MAEEGITNGVGGGRFAPSDVVTRGQFAAFLYRYESPPPAAPHDFSDVVAGWQQEPVSWLAEERITVGTAPGRFSPDEPVTRGQLATFLYRYRGMPPVAHDESITVCQRPFVVHAVGDVNFDPGYGPNPQLPYSDAWSGMGRLFLDDDLTIINLECAPSLLGTRVPKTYNFRCPLEALAPARDAGIEVANLANNHGADFGIPALIDGYFNVAAAGIKPVGVGMDLAAATRPAIFERDDVTFAVLGFNAVNSSRAWEATDAKAGMAYGDIDVMVAAVEAANERADYVFVTIHWGIEKTFSPAADDIPRAHALIDAGADAVFGHGPHRVQPLEFYNDRPIFWSLGNFVWHNLTRQTAVAEVLVAPDGTISASLIPGTIVSKGHPVLD